MSANDSRDAYRFSIVNGQIVGVQEWDDGYWQNERIDANETWQLVGTRVIKTETERGITETSVFEDVNGDGVYDKVSESYSSSSVAQNSNQPALVSEATDDLHEGSMNDDLFENSVGDDHFQGDNGRDAYRFSIVNGQIVGVQEWDDGYWQNERIEANETWQLIGTRVIKTETERGITETSVFEDVNGDNLYDKVSESYSSSGAAPISNQRAWVSEATDDWHEGSTNDDLFEDSVGDDHFHGGDGYDSVHFSYNSDDIQEYGMSDDGRFVMIKTATGIETLESIESINFLDGTFSPSSAQANPLYTNYQSGLTGYELAERFEGDDSLNLEYQLISQDEAAVLSGSSFNDFIKLAGAGNKAVDGSSGDDVLDGGIGSTFMTGGGIDTIDTFFLDGRSDGDAWSTITDFQMGTDQLTIWGWREGVSSVEAVSETDGAIGYTGLTLKFNNLIDDSGDGLETSGDKFVTLTGLGVQDFGVNSLESLNSIIAEGGIDSIHAGSVFDQFGDHGFWMFS
jgi:hypothetical protein